MKRKTGAQERTRTFTALRPQVPETCASTNSATWAKGAGAFRRDARIYALGGGASRRRIGGWIGGAAPEALAGVAAGVSQRRAQGWCGGCAPNQSLLPRTPPGLGRVPDPRTLPLVNGPRRQGWWPLESHPLQAFIQRRRRCACGTEANRKIGPQLALVEKIC